MKLLLLLLVIWSSTAYGQTQNCDALNLPTGSLTESQVRAKAKALWGADYIVRSEWHGSQTYSIKSIGRHVRFEDYDFGFAKTPRKRVRQDILGTDNRGSWSRAWNNAMVAWCKQGGVVP